MILTALASLYERMAEKGEAPKRGYSSERIGGEVVIDRQGHLVAINPKFVADGNRLVAAKMDVPFPPPNRRGKKIVPGFLWDPVPYALGASLSAEKEFSLTADHATEKHASFCAFHREMLVGLDDEGARALLAFLDQWQPDSLASQSSVEDILTAKVVFRLEGDTRSNGQNRYLHERPKLVSAWLGQLSEESEGHDQVCLVTGKAAPIARLHPSISGLGKNAQSSGAYLVSFNIGSKDIRGASSSYGKTQGDNAPVSEEAAFAYGSALNALLARSGSGPGRRALRLGDTTTVFWAETPTRTDDEAAEDLMAGLLDPPSDEETEGEAADKLRITLEALAKGAEPDDPRFHPATRVYMLGLAPNAARLSVRFWQPGTLGEFARNVLRFHDDLAINPPASKHRPAAWALLYETALQHKAENIPPLLGGALMRSVLGGLPYPRLLLAAVIGRIRADGIVNGPRAAICKAYLTRNLKEDIPVSLDPDNPDPAYRLGRLFAVLESIQQAALPGLNATIRDRYFAAASATPARVFPLLVKTATHHLANLRKGDKGGLAHWFDEQMGEIMSGLASDLAGSLTLEDQGRFVVGYYHQKYTKKATSEAEQPIVEEAE
ncbi:type I-C CRISPR-associated protein Cas8c/Csd1 [Rhodovulum strictum]|uniref:Type I-C CRISPR-associated protein Cas8c/Csd1 n=1 Tax=Rhodovulum strictum TaxID=58314 RepID=A0A844BS36_9RHOB|nr:type I-C CRISPR-associated protein Cas8c/Csd1 [Rhodovulum strictum]MRH22747.1 type I-C CRISPR-associated protein Cas8c/Csd1 [Rhodovulum strictum]